MNDWRALMAVLAAIVLIRVVEINQPPVENYVGRQVPTAMVARNLDRGGSWLRPELDTGPFPNRFVIEPPVFGMATVGVRHLTGLSIVASGRLLSALGMALGGWGLYGLVRRREGAGPALVAVIVFGTMPLTIRYGRAVQGDALMLGCLLGSLRLWDESSSSLARRVLGGLLLAAALALKIIAAWVVMVVVVLGARRRTRPWLLLLMGLSIVPAASWYGYALPRLGSAEGSGAAADTASLWFRAIGPWGLLDGLRAGLLARFIAYRSFTPLALPLVLLGGLVAARAQAAKPDRFWTVYTLAAVGGLAMVGGKLHHEYYLLAVAPAVAVGVARGLAATGRWQSGWTAWLVGGAWLGFCVLQSVDTFRLPKEWERIEAGAVQLQRRVPATEWVAASEALLYAADRRGARMEFSPGGAHRAAGEWSGANQVNSPLELVAFYASAGVSYFADLVPAAEDRDRAALHAALRSRYTEVEAGPDVVLLRVGRAPGVTMRHGRQADQ